MTKEHIEKLRAFLMERLAEKNNTIFHEAHFEELIATCNVALGVMPLTDNNGTPLSQYVPSASEPLELLRRVWKANIIFPSLCANNMEAMTILEDIRKFLEKHEIHDISPRSE